MGYRVGANAEDYVEKKFLHPSRIGWLAFDAWIYHRSNELPPRANSPEVWRYGNFNI